MSGKSRGSKGKSSHHSKKSRAKQRYGSIPITPSSAQTPNPAVATVVTTSPKKPTPTGFSRIVHHPHITTELSRIGILAGIILVILIVLALILS